MRIAEQPDAKRCVWFGGTRTGPAGKYVIRDRGRRPKPNLRPTMLDTNDGGESRRRPSRSQQLVPIPLSHVPHPLRNTSRKQPTILFFWVFGFGESVRSMPIAVS